MATTFGNRPEDVVADSRGNVLSGVVLQLYPTEADALAQSASVGQATTDETGSWPFTDSGSRSLLWVRDPSGRVWPVGSEEALASVGTKVDRDSLVMVASDHGVVGDGITDDGAALNALLTSAATLGVPVMFEPLSTILTSVQIIPPSGSRINGNGATLKAKSTMAAGDRLIYLSGASNVTIENLTVDGDKASYATVTEQRHGVMVTAACSGITLRNVKAVNCKGDGVYIGGGAGSAASSDIYLDNVTCDGNHRNGLSVTAVSGLTAIGCRFVNTSGTAPQNGVDIEVNTDTDVLEGVVFIGCVASGNARDGFEVLCRSTATVRQGDVSFIGCSSLDNTRHGYLLYNVNGVKVVAGQVSGNTECGIYLTGTVSNEDVVISGVTVSKNLRYGIRVEMAFNDLRITDTTVKDNGSSVPGFYPGIDLAPTAASTNVHVMGCRSTGADQPYGYRDNANVSKASLVSNRFAGSSSAMSLASVVTSRVVIDESGTVTIPLSTYVQAASTAVFNAYTTGDANPRLTLRTDGTINIGSGSAAADVILSRPAAKTLALPADNAFKTGRAVTGSRPSAATVGAGSMFYDTTLSKPIWSDGTNWKDAAGTTV